MRHFFLFMFLGCALPLNAATVSSDPALTKANNDYLQSVAELGETEQACSEAEVVLPADTFAAVKLTQAELKVALRYHHLKSFYECHAEAVRAYLVSAAVLAALAKQERAQSIYESSELIVDTKLRLIKTEDEYERLSQTARDALEDIQALQRPFKLIESAEVLGL